MRRATILVLSVCLPVLFAVLGGCSSTSMVERHSGYGIPAQFEVLHTEDGLASYYSNAFHGRTTASGERYDKTEFTTAHRTYPFGTYLRVTSRVNGNSVIVRVNDRGPAKASRLLDLSKAAAVQLGMIRAGVVRVTVDVLKWGG